MLDKNMFWIDERYCAEGLVSHIYGYCRCCRKTHEIPLENLTQHQGPKRGDCTRIWSGATMSYVSMKRFKCPNCGKVMTSSNTHILNSGDTYPNLLEYSIKRKGRKISYKASCIFYSINPFRGKLRTRIYDYRIVFDTENGQTYLFAIRDSYKKKTYVPGMVNVSYAVYPLEYKLYFDWWTKYTTESIRKKIFEMICQMYAKDGINVKSEGDSKTLERLQNILLINRFPGLDPSFIYSHRGYFTSYMDKVNPAFREIRNKDMDRQKDEVSAFGLRPEHQKKSLLRIAYQKTMVLNSYFYFRDIKSIDLLIRCLVYFDPKRYYGQTKQNGQNFMRFLKALIREHGENIGVNKYLNTTLNIFSDTANMYHALEKEKIKVNLNGTVQEIHDRMIHEYNRIQSQSRPIQYTTKKLELNSVVDGHEIVLAKDTDEMKKVGNLLNICVGSYDDMAVAKQLMIAFVKKDDQYVACIELDASGKEIRQAKTKFNKLPQGEIRDAILKWIDEKNLKICTGDISRTKRRDLAA